MPRDAARGAIGLDPDEPCVLFPADPRRPEKRFDRAQELAGDTRLHTLGAVPPDQVPLWVNAANAVLIPSDREGFGLAVLEALACDVPVLATPVGIHEEALRDLPGTLCAPFELARECARAMIAVDSSGTIVNVASIWGLVGVGQIPEAGYAASKGGLVNLTRELSAQWARRGVRVNCLAPGWFRSEMTEGLMFGDENAERWMRQRTPMGRGGEEHELDGALLFLASAASTFMTGQIVCIDGA